MRMENACAAYGRLSVRTSRLALRPTCTAKSPRMEPGVAAMGLVAPIAVRQISIAFGPSTTSAATGVLVMYSTRLLKNGLPTCSL